MTRRWGRDPFRTGLVQAVEDAARQALASSTTPGLAVALVHHGRLIWAAGYGAATAHPHDAHGRQIGNFAFAEQAAAGLVTTAPDLARFLAAALAGPRGEPPGRGMLSPAGVQVALTAAPATDGRWGLGYGLGLTPGGDLLAYHEGANRGWRAGLALLPDRRAGIALLANGDAGSGRMQGRTNRR